MRMMKKLAWLIIVIIVPTLLFSNTMGLLRTSIIMSSHGTILNLRPLHVEGKYIKDDLGNIVLLRGVCLYEIQSYIDHIKYDQPIATRVQVLKNLGINCVRLPINKADWDTNKDTNGDGVGCRDFNYQVIDAFTAAGIHAFVGLHYGVSIDEETSWANNPQIVTNWYLNNIINRYKNNPGVHIYIWNEPHYELWGGSDLGGGVSSGYWTAMQLVCASLHNAKPDALIVVHADMYNEGGFCPVLRSNHINVGNVIYTWHYYYCYGPALQPYHPWLSGIDDPTYEELKQRGYPYYQSYAAGNLTKARQEFETSLYNRFLWVPQELNLTIINDEFGFTGNDMPYFSRRVCDICHWIGNVADCLYNGSLKQPPYTGDVYCPNCSYLIPQPQPYAEPGWPNCLSDFLSIMEKYDCNWQYFSWWPKEFGSYGLSDDPMTSLSVVGQVVAEYLNSTSLP